MLIEKSNKINASLKECHSFWTAMRLLTDQFQRLGLTLNHHDGTSTRESVLPFAGHANKRAQCA